MVFIVLRWATQLKSSAWSIAEYLVYPLLMFATTPIFIAALGEEQYGQWMLLVTLNSMALLGGFGMGVAGLKEVSTYQGRGDMASAALAARVALLLTLITGTIFAVLVLLTGFIGAGTFLAKMGEPGAILLIFSFAAALIAIEQIDSVFAGVIRGMERFDLSAKVESIAKSSTVAAMAVAAITSGELFHVLVALTVMTVCRAAAKAVVASSLLAQGPLWPTWERDHALRVFHFGKWAWVQSVGGALFSVADRLLVGSMLGAEALARYSIALQLAQQIHTIPAAGGAFIFPAASRRLAEGGTITGMAWKGALAVCCLALAVALPIILFAETILTAWVGTAIAEQVSTPLRWLGFGFLLLAINIGPHYILLGGNASKFVALTGIAGGIMSAVAALFLIPLAGLVGAAQARIAYSLAIAFNFLGMHRLTRRGVHDGY